MSVAYFSVVSFHACVWHHVDPVTDGQSTCVAYMHTRTNKTRIRMCVWVSRKPRTHDDNNCNSNNNNNKKNNDVMLYDSVNGQTGMRA